MASSADSRQTTATKIPLPKHVGSKVVNKKSCDANSSARSTGKSKKEIGPRKVSSAAIREVGTKQSPSAVSSKVQTSVTKELPGSRETKSSVTKNIKKDQPIVSKEIKKERQQTTVSKDIRKEHTSVSREVIKEKNQTIVSRDVKKEQTIVSKVFKKDQTIVSNDVKKQNSAVSVSDIQPAKTTLKDQADDTTEYSSSVLRREQTVIYVGPPIKTDNISVNKLPLVTDTNQKTGTTDIGEDSNCSHQNEEHPTPSKIEISCQNETPKLTSLNFRNEEDSVVMENIKNELSPDSKEIADFVDVVHITKHTCHSRKESRKGKISDSSDSGVSLGGADVAQIDDFYDDTIGVQAKKEVQEFSEVLNTCDDENDTSLISGVNSNVVETSLATVTNLKEGIPDYDCDENHGERGSKFLGLHNYVPSNLKVRL
jgi:hypothetical protein